MKDLLPRFLRYCVIDTQANAKAAAKSIVPSSPGQMQLAKLLVDELQSLGIEANVNQHAYVIASLPARNASKDSPTIGLLAHLDTACEASGIVRPRVITQYDGKDITLCPGMVLSPQKFPKLKEKLGKSLVVTDGTSLLGADDKSGIAIIMTVLAILQQNKDLAHAAIKVAFVPDEEVSHGAALLDLDQFAADFAYTVDGSGHGALQYENFYAAEATILFEGLPIHPGQAKDQMINAILLAQEFINALPPEQSPRNTEGYEGFYHVTALEGEVAKACLKLIIRDHDATVFTKRKAFLQGLADQCNARYPATNPRVQVSIEDQYANMYEKIKPHQYIIDIALEAMRACNVTPVIHPVRGGTDGAKLSWRGLPTPNLFCGDYNIHGPYEFTVLEDMQDSVRVVLNIVESCAKESVQANMQKMSAFEE